MQCEMLVLGALLMCGGCMIWDAGYTNNVDVDHVDVSSYEQVPISYDVEVTSSVGEAGELAKVFKVRERIEQALSATGLFSEVKYGNKNGEDSYHVGFTVRFSPTSQDKMFGHIFVSEISLLLIPNGDVEGLDVSATLYLKGKPIYATAKPEELRYLIWLPLTPVGLFMNTWTVGGAIVDGSVNSCVNDIVREHRKQFLAK